MASGDTLGIFTAPALHVNAASTMPIVRIRNAHRDFLGAGAGSDFMDWGGFMPRHYSGGSVIVTLTWATQSATSGTFTFSAAIHRYGAGANIDVLATATAVSQSGTAPGASGVLSTMEMTLTAANMGSIQAGELYMLRIRWASVPAGAEVLCAELREA